MIAGTMPVTDSGLDRKAPRSAPTVAGPQCDGAAMTTRVGVWPSSTVRAIASRAAATRLSPRCEEPSAAMSGTGSPTRSTNPRSTTPGWFRLGLVSSGFCEGTPTSGGRSPHKVNTDRRATGCWPGRAATRLVVPIDSPSALLTVHFPSQTIDYAAMGLCVSPVAVHTAAADSAGSAVWETGARSSFR